MTLNEGDINDVWLEYDFMVTWNKTFKSKTFTLYINKQNNNITLNIYNCIVLSCIKKNIEDILKYVKKYLEVEEFIYFEKKILDHL